MPRHRAGQGADRDASTRRGRSPSKGKCGMVGSRTHIADPVVVAIRAGKTTYCDPQGLVEVRTAIAAKVGADRGLDVDPQRVVVFAGGRPPIGLAQHAYLEAGDEV